jgi:hypothetical protein
MDVCLRLFWDCVVLYWLVALRRADPQSKEYYQLSAKIHNFRIK